MQPILASDFGPPDWLIGSWFVMVCGSAGLTLAAAALLLLRRKTGTRWLAALAMVVGLFPALCSAAIAVLLNTMNEKATGSGLNMVHLASWLPFALAVPIFALTFGGTQTRQKP